MAETRELDVIIFGATGFTGKYTVLEGVKLLADYKWGIAGRNRSKLEATLKEIGEKVKKDLSDIPIIIADVDDAESLKKMAEKCKVVINTTGPYRLWGEAVVKACINAGTHQVDVSGEPQWIERMALEYNDKAKEKDSYIVSACGFDSIPADLGVVFLEKHFDGTVNSVEHYLASSIKNNTSGAILNHGTWDSAVHGIANWSELKELRAKLYPERLPTFKPKLKAKPVIHKQSQLNTWCLPFMGSDASIVYRSQRYFYETENKRPIQIKAYMALGSFINCIALILFGLFFGIMAKFSFTRSLLLRYPEIFSFGLCSKDGVSEETMRNSKFSIHLFGKGWSKKLNNATETPDSKPDKSIHVKVSGTNPGYGFTCVALILSGITLIKEKNKLPQNGGVYTTAAAFSNTNLIEELCKNGANFEVLNVREKAE